MGRSTTASRDGAARERNLRVVTSALGSALLVGGLRAGRAGGILLATGGASLLVRGITGRRMSINRIGRRARPKMLSRPNRVELRRAITIYRPADEVYAFFHRPDDVRRTLAHLSEAERSAGVTQPVQIERLPEGGVRFAVREGGAELAWTVEIVDEIPNQRIAFRHRPGSELECEGSIDLVPAPGDRGTEVRLHLRCEPPGGRVVLALAPLLRFLGKHQLGRELARMKQLIETGEIATSATEGREPATHTVAPGAREVHA
jgi:uncharacterized membrane protein